jgi:hypothetical protein
MTGNIGTLVLQTTLNNDCWNIMLATASIQTSINRGFYVFAFHFMIDVRRKNVSGISNHIPGARG